MKSLRADVKPPQSQNGYSNYIKVDLKIEILGLVNIHVGFLKVSMENNEVYKNKVKGI